MPTQLSVHWGDLRDTIPRFRSHSAACCHYTKTTTVNWWTHEESNLDHTLIKRGLYL